jgi:hypothetical protein
MVFSLIGCCDGTRDTRYVIEKAGGNVNKKDEITPFLLLTGDALTIMTCPNDTGD